MLIICCASHGCWQIIQYSIVCQGSEEAVLPKGDKNFVRLLLPFMIKTLAVILYQCACGFTLVLF